MLTIITLAFLAAPPCVAPPSTLPRPDAPIKARVGSAKITTTKQTVTTTRAASGHTHTCANGHTWDHAANPTHRCQFCGQTQFVQDRTPRPVTVVRVVESPTVVRMEASSWSQTVIPPTIRTINRATSSGCANGNCPVVR